NQAIGGVVVHHQHGQIVDIAWLSRSGSGRSLRKSEPGGEVESAASARGHGTFDVQLSAHHCHKLRGDRQPQTGAAKAATVAAIDLLEWLENNPLFVQRNADARIR